MGIESKPQLANGFKDGVIVRSSQNYLIEEGYKNGDPDSENERFFITPLNTAAESMLLNAARLHLINTEAREVSDISGKVVNRACIRLDFSKKNWKEIICNDVLTEPDQSDFPTSPTLQRLNFLIRRGDPKYSFRTS